MHVESDSCGSRDVGAIFFARAFTGRGRGQYWGVVELEPAGAAEGPGAGKLEKS